MLQEINDGRWHVESLSGTSPSGYIITRHITTYQQCTSQDDKVCMARECNFLCPHMYKCDDKCYHFNNGHICKHIHRVHSLSHIRQLSNPQTESSVTEEKITLQQLMRTTRKVLTLQMMNALAV